MPKLNGDWVYMRLFGERFPRAKAGMSSSVGSGVTRLVIFIAMSSCFLVAFSTTSAYASGIVTWQAYDACSNAPCSLSGEYLEVYHSSTANGASADVFSWNGSNTQYWNDVPQPDKVHWVEQNYNSGLVLDADAPSCRLQQWQWLAGKNQQWKEIQVSSGHWKLINWAGCGGDPYRDMLSVANWGTGALTLSNDNQLTCFPSISNVPCLWH
jgi:hypothetical protein